jgi:hypothetical protein
MSDKFFGVPLFVWVIFCLALAVVWVIFWPRDRVGVAGGFRYIVLRWFHALTWLLLAVAALIAGLDSEGNAPLAKVISLLSLVVYLIFMGTFVTSASSR